MMSSEFLAPLYKLSSSRLLYPTMMVEVMRPLP